jgi:hypothetical protein
MNLVELPAAISIFGYGERKIMTHGFQMGMNFERPAKTNSRFAVLANRHVAKPLTGGSTEVIRVSRQRFLAVGDGTCEVSPHEAYGGALISTFRKAGSDIDDACKFRLRFCQLSLLHDLYSGAKNPIHFGIS